ncbi:uncharacterized protein LOC117489864 [Trematomus bernacchii]|uniref:uncharacterized protein LOC117489864 n=1 Tax=Trematomus bernacchii TaxID=40690 RepID=UPI00146B0FDF|nr:uncharacterized protein LOC117489864 [Trematomus bernacchii]
MNINRWDESTDRDEEEEWPIITGNLLLTEDMWKQQECVSSVIVSMDLSALLRGSVKCRKPKPPSTKETSTEAFENYMRILYGLPLDVKVDLEDKLDPVEPEIASFDPDPYQKEPVTLPVLKKVVHREAIVEVAVKKKIKKKKKDPETTPPPKPLKQFKPVARVEKPIKVNKYKEEEPKMSIDLCYCVALLEEEPKMSIDLHCVYK